MFRRPLLSDLFALRDAVDELVNAGVGSDRPGASPPRGGAATTQPMALDVYATDGRAIILAAVPGMRPDQLDLAVHENTVTLSGWVDDPSDADETKKATWYLHELWSGAVRRSVTLPFPVDADRAEATFEHGMLRVVLPKAEAATPRKIQITTGSRPAAAVGAESGADAAPAS